MSGRSVRPISFPFAAIYGNERAKTALLCAAVNPRIKSILLKGASGTAKTTIARSFADLTVDKKLVNIPLNVTEDRLFGTIDLESAISTGIAELQDGLLNDADGNYIYLDDVNLFDKKVLNAILNAVESEYVLMERDGISASYRCRTTLIASLNTSGMDLEPSFLDMFDICVNLDDKNDNAERKEVLERVFLFEKDPESFYSLYDEEQDKLKSKIHQAKDLVPSVEIPPQLMYTAASVSQKLNIKSHRGDISIINVCVSLAALDGRVEAIPNDVKEASVMCLYHRREKQANVPTRKSILFFDHRTEKEEDVKKDIAAIRAKEGGEPSADWNDAKNIELTVATVAKEIIDEVEEELATIDLTQFDNFKDVAVTRDTVTSKDRSGRYVDFKQNKNNNPDIAFDATIRNAAPYQLKRRKNENDQRFMIEKNDLMEKVRKKRRRFTFMFMMDNSGSLIIKNRIKIVKNSIRAMLETHYVRRDRVGFMIFSEDAVDIVLEPTRSVDLIFDALDDAKIGMGTPLAQALVTMSDYMDIYTRKHPDEICYIVLITDGKANIPIIEGNDIINEVFDVAESMNNPNLRWVIIDSGIGLSKTDIPYELSSILGGVYFTLDELKEDPSKLKKIE